MKRRGSALRHESASRRWPSCRCRSLQPSPRPALPVARRFPRNSPRRLRRCPASGCPPTRRSGRPQPAAYPAVHDIPPPRNSVVLTNTEAAQLEDDLVTARDQQQSARRRQAATEEEGPKAAGQGRSGLQPGLDLLGRAQSMVQGDASRLGRSNRAICSRDRRWKSSTASGACRPTCSRQVNRAKAVARNAGADIIDLGMGNPDLPAPAHVIEKMKETLGKSRTDRYSSSKGIPGLRRAQAAYYARRFGVKLNPDTQIVATLGSKEGFANVAQAITAPGDVVLVPDPSYPIHAFGFLMAGGVIRSVPSEPTPEFLRDARARHHPFDPEADRGRGLLSVEPDRPCRRSRLLQGARAVREEARHLHPVRSRLCRSLFRRQSAAVGAAGAGRDRRRRRIHLDVEDLFDAGLAHGLCGRQRAHHRGAWRG